MRENDAHPMPTDPLETHRNEAFRRLGRNIALFQALEKLLKELTASSLIEGPPAEIEGRAARRKVEIADKTLGQVFGQFKGDVLSDAAELNDARAPWVRIRFSVEGDDYRNLKSAQLEQLVSERNRLVHHLHNDYDLSTAEGIQRLSDLLEPQGERVRQEIRGLYRLLADWAEARAAIATQLAAMSEEFVDSF